MKRIQVAGIMTVESFLLLVYISQELYTLEDIPSKLLSLMLTLFSYFFWVLFLYFSVKAMLYENKGLLIFNLVLVAILIFALAGISLVFDTL